MLNSSDGGKLRAPHPLQSGWLANSNLQREKPPRLYCRGKNHLKSTKPKFPCLLFNCLKYFLLPFASL